MARFGFPSIASDLENLISQGLVDVEKVLTDRIEGNYLFANETSRHLIEAGGKRFRPMLVLLGSYLGNGPNSNVIKAAAVCELTHLATLYHDDVMDEAELRRGVPSANSRWGNSVAILTGDYLFAKMSQLLAELGPEAVKLQADTFERLVIGQIMETKGPGPSENHLDYYLKVVSEKTGSLIATSLHFGALMSGVDKKTIQVVSEFGEKIGVAFQLADDVIDIASPSHLSGKTPGTDLREGIPTLVTLNVIAMNRAEDRALIESLNGPIKSDAKVAKVLAELRDHPALEVSRKQLKQLAKEARDILGGIPISPISAAFYSLCDSIIDRVA